MPKKTMMSEKPLNTLVAIANYSCLSQKQLSSYSFPSLLDRVLKESKKMFGDVIEDFHSLDCIKSRFEVWRKLYFTCYRDAYIGLCLPKLFNPLIRLQLIPWSPLEVWLAFPFFFLFSPTWTNILLQTDMSLFHLTSRTLWLCIFIFAALNQNLA